MIIMKDMLSALKTKLFVASLAIAAISWTAGTCSAQTPAPALPPGVQDVVKLAHAGMGEDVILAQIKSTGASYNLSADQIIYLGSQGVSQNVIKALLPTAGAPAYAAPAPAVPAAPVVPTANTVPSAPTMSPMPGMTPAPPAVLAPPDSSANYDYFHGQLMSYGTWMNLPGYGSVWRPTIAAETPGWRPYCDSGHWVYTDNGWFWQSDYPWGDIAFHYGRWLRSDVGWVWVPGYDWAPAWVSWRRADLYCGWAPLPPGAVFKVGVGLTFNGAVAVDTDFGLGVDAFTFVSYDHFWDRDFRVWVVPHDRVVPIFRASFVLNGYKFDHGHFFVEGLGRENIARLTHRDVRVEAPIFHDDRLHHDDVRFSSDHRDDRRPDSRNDSRDSRNSRDDRRDHQQQR